MTDILKHLDLNSADGTQLNLDALYQIAPSAFTEVRDDKTGEISRKVNFEVLRRLLGDYVTDGDGEMYQFTWVGKNAARAEAAKPRNLPPPGVMSYRLVWQPPWIGTIRRISISKVITWKCSNSCNAHIWVR